MISSLIWNLRGVGNNASMLFRNSLSFISFLVLLEPFVDSSQVVSLNNKLGLPVQVVF